MLYLTVFLRDFAVVVLPRPILLFMGKTLKETLSTIASPYLNIARNGDYSTKGNLRSDPQRLQLGLDRLEARLKLEPVRLVVFVHGGLNGETSAALTHLHLEQHLYTPMNAFAFPIFWESGLLDATGYLIANTPFGEWFLDAGSEFTASNGAERQGWLSSWQLKVKPRSEPRPGAAAQARTVEYLARLFGVGAFGRRLWDTMKFQTKNTFSGNVTASDGQGEMPGRALLRRLVALKLEYPERLSIDLIGHSAGTILLGHFFEAAASLRREHRLTQRDFPARLVDHLIFLAPAITYVDFENHVWRNQDLFLDLNIFGLRSEYENDSRELLHQIYPATLLYLVSNVFEEQIGAAVLGLQRDAVASAPNFRAVREYLAKTNVVWSPTTGSQAGSSANATSHGGFPRDALTIQSMIEVLSRRPA